MGTTEFVRLSGPATTLVAATPGPDLDARGYAESEWTASGTAPRYIGEAIPFGGRATATVADTAPFTTRLVVRQPRDPSDFSGTVVAEWLNVSSGDDAAPDYTYLAEEIVRQGHVRVGVSAQYVGVEGGRPTVGDLTPAAQNGLRHREPNRYGNLRHPGDAYCFGIFTETVDWLTRAGGPLAGWPVTTLLAVGESQSAFALATYVNAVHPLVDLFDGFLLHSRGGAAMGWGRPGEAFDLDTIRHSGPMRIRDDLRTPVITVQTETDVISPRLAFLGARQDDSDAFRLWEVAGSAHADLWQIGPFEELLGCPDPVNRGQQAFVLRAALRSLEAWVRDGVRPPQAARLSVIDGALDLDDLGNARGGVRTPVVDAGVEILSGLAAPEASVLCSLFGRTLPASPDAIAARFADADAYLSAYEAATDRAIADGFILAEDRDAVLAEARPDLLPSRSSSASGS